MRCTELESFAGMLYPAAFAHGDPQGGYACLLVARGALSLGM